jgi:glycosyltransferase involved in cell wall biosynthesis
MIDILVISDDVVGRKMAGPGIRAWELSGSLAGHFKVTLAVPDYSSPDIDAVSAQKSRFAIFHYALAKPSLLKEIAENSRIILAQGYILSKFPFIKELSAHLILDLYVPFPLENLFVHKWNIPNQKDREFVHLNDLRVFNDQIIHGDHFLPRQKDLFMGALMSLNRINPECLDLDPTLEDLISVVPFGLPEAEESGSPKLLRQKYPQIKPDDILLIWGGVMTNWFDPLTLIKAVHKAREENPGIKLFFLSTKHPNPLLPAFTMAREAEDLSLHLGLTDQSVFFNQEWVEYHKRGGYLGDADIGVSIHKTHFETYYSFRTRILDYLNYELPTICTEGDFFADLVQKENLGLVVASENVDELAAAILKLARDKELRRRMKQNIQKIKPDFYWDRVADPLVRYCRKALSNQSPRKGIPREKELIYLCTAKKKGLLQGPGKKFYYRFAQKMPFRLVAKIKRYLPIFL